MLLLTVIVRPLQDVRPALFVLMASLEEHDQTQLEVLLPHARSTFLIKAHGHDKRSLLFLGKGEPPAVVIYTQN